MSEHSCLDYADEVCTIAREAPIKTDQDYEATLELLEDAHKTLRGVFVGGQEPGVPDSWRIDGLLYRAWDMELTKAKDRLLQRLRASKFFGAMRRREKAVERDKRAISDRWYDLDSEEQALKLKQRGFDIRMTTSKQGKPLYQYATRKEVARGRTQL